MTEEAPVVEVTRDGETTVRHGDASITTGPHDPEVEETPDGWTAHEEDGVLHVETPADRVTVLGSGAGHRDDAALPDDPEHVVSAPFVAEPARTTVRDARNVVFVGRGHEGGADRLPSERTARAAGRGTGKAVSTATHGSVAVRRDGEEHVVETEADPGAFLYELAGDGSDVEQPAEPVDRSEFHRHAPDERTAYDGVVARIEAAREGETDESRYVPDETETTDLTLEPGS